MLNGAKDTRRTRRDHGSNQQAATNDSAVFVAALASSRKMAFDSPIMDMASESLRFCPPDSELDSAGRPGCLEVVGDESTPWWPPVHCNQRQRRGCPLAPAHSPLIFSVRPTSATLAATTASICPEAMPLIRPNICGRSHLFQTNNTSTSTPLWMFGGRNAGGAGGVCAPPSAR